MKGSIPNEKDQHPSTNLGLLLGVLLGDKVLDSIKAHKP